MSQSKQSLVTIFSLVAKAVLMIGFTLPVLSLYGEGDAQTTNIETAEQTALERYEAQGDTAAVEALAAAIESLESN